MEENKKQKSLGLAQWIQIAVYAVLGVLLIMWPSQSQNIIFTILGCGLCVWGIIKIIIYFREDVQTGMVSQSFSIGAGLIVVGVVITIFAEKLGNMMAVIFACMLLFGAIYKIQMAFDLKKLKSDNWFIPLFAALISMVLAILIFVNLFNTDKVLIIFIGVSLVIEAILNMMSVIFLNRKLKSIKDENLS